MAWDRTVAPASWGHLDLAAAGGQSEAAASAGPIIAASIAASIAVSIAAGLTAGAWALEVLPRRLAGVDRMARIMAHTMVLAMEEGRGRLAKAKAKARLLVVAESAGAAVAAVVAAAAAAPVAERAASVISAELRVALKLLEQLAEQVRHHLQPLEAPDLAAPRELQMFPPPSGRAAMEKRMKAATKAAIRTATAATAKKETAATSGAAAVEAASAGKLNVRPQIGAAAAAAAEAAVASASGTRNGRRSVAASLLGKG